ncbi:hypothetical protein Ocin01_10021 [Orchesella cincta]|uniref:Uncharacterized protein n=1 Tax=Orchesella cincta TaxID=48709 RepID=A0A1D2MU93_ORCCI|nr:hypothetical protein Ocin01_10021 [Orchesella cincta]
MSEIEKVRLFSSVKEQPLAGGGGDGESVDDKTFPEGNKGLESEGNGFQLELVLPIILKMKLNLPEESRAFPLRASRKPGAQLLATERLFGQFGMKIWGSFINVGSKSVCWETDEGYIQRILAHPRNPFVGRSLRLRTNSLSHWFMGRTLLEQFGNEFWFLCYLVDESTNISKWIPVEQRIREALLLVPNLKWFRLDVAFPFPMKPDEVVPSLELEARVAQFFLNNPLPRLLNLETLSCDRFFHTSPMFLSPILECCCVPETLKRLDVSNSKLKYKPSLVFPNLEELGIRIELKDLGSLNKTSPHLKKISLVLTNRADDGSHQGINADQVFGFLESFQETLEDLGIGRELQEVHYPFTFKPEFKIFLPNLKSLELDWDIPVESLENLGSLKNLLLHSFCEEEQVENYKMNIGRMVPSLESFECSGIKGKVKMGVNLTTGELVVQSYEKYQVYGDLDKEDDTRRSRIWNVILLTLSSFIALEEASWPINMVLKS